MDIHYSFDNSSPDNFYPKYQLPVTAPKDARYMKVITYRAGKPIGRMISLPVTELKKELRSIDPVYNLLKLQVLSRLNFRL